ncbi:hypothetical protein IJG90_04475 [Candidatus Saccharibacteria bacterium]|nr:hypothetical protein [Candidatus Saccharibacteria bacterium]
MGIAKSSYRRSKSRKIKVSRTPVSALTKNRPHIKSSHLASSHKKDFKIYNYSRRTILVVIFLAMMSVTFSVLSIFYFSPEQTTTRTIQSLAQDYYENYLYDLVGSENTSNKTREEIFERYAEHGFANYSLNQLLNFDNGRHIKSASSLTKYCDPVNTFVRIYPDSPFGRTDYHIVYTYSCKF